MNGELGSGMNGSCPEGAVRSPGRAPGAEGKAGRVGGTRGTRTRWFVLGLALMGLGCGEPLSGPESSAVSDASPPSQPEPEPLAHGEVDDCALTGLTPGQTPLRRLTRRQYENTIRDLFDGRVAVSGDFPSVAVQSGFSNDYEVNIFDYNGTYAVMEAAEDIAEQIVSDMPTLLGCDPDERGEQGCLQHLLVELAPRLFRRPLTPDEQTSLEELFAEIRSTGNFLEAIGWTLAAIFQSPQFLYFTEMGELEGAAPGTAVPLDDYAIANRLSYMLWNTMPDDVLFEAAAQSKLSAPEQIAEQVRRMLDDPRAREGVSAFHREWLGVERLKTAQKTDEVFDDELADSMRLEVGARAAHLILDVHGDLETLLTTPTSVVDGPLAAFYGLDAPMEGGDWQVVEREPGERSGLLSSAGWLAVHAHQDQSSIVKRGVWIRRHLMCGNMPPPPPGVDLTLPPFDPDISQRDHLAAHRESPACANCHDLIDPIGVAFENYDAIGRWREHVGSVPVDPSGEVVGSELEFAFDDPLELATRLATHPGVQRCVPQQWFRYTQGRHETNEDDCTIERLTQQFVAAGTDLRELLVFLTQTDAFLYRLAPELEGGE